MRPTTDTGIWFLDKIWYLLVSPVLFLLSAGVIVCICAVQVCYLLIVDKDCRNDLLEPVYKWLKKKGWRG
jgi:hypothetical protein